MCKGIGAEGDTLVLVMQNATGQKITINPFTGITFDGEYGYAAIIYQGTTYRFQDVTINAGDQFRIEGYGMVLSDEISITYKEEATGLTKTATSGLGTDADNDTELGNDGLDTGSLDGVDCADAGVEDCHYMVDADTGFDTGMDTSYKDIPFGNLKGVDGTPVGTGSELWKATSVALAFYVTDSGPAGTKPRVEFAGTEFSSGEANVKVGWNVVEIDDVSLDNPFYFTGDDIPPVRLKAQSGSFTISDTITAEENYLPKAVFIVNSPG